MTGICDEIMAQYGATQQGAAEPRRKRQAVETAGSEAVADGSGKVSARFWPS
jgi:hypothetical protein